MSKQAYDPEFPFDAVVGQGLATFLQNFDHAPGVNLNELFWKFLHRVKELHAPFMTGYNMREQSSSLPMDLMRVVAHEIGQYDEGTITAAWINVCALVASDFKMPDHERIPLLEEFYSTAVFPDTISFDKGWVVVKLLVLAMYEMADRTCKAMDLKHSNTVPAYVELDNSGQRAVLLVRPWIILYDNRFYSFKDTNNQDTR